MKSPTGPICDRCGSRMRRGSGRTRIVNVVVSWGIGRRPSTVRPVDTYLCPACDRHIANVNRLFYVAMFSIVGGMLLWIVLMPR